MVRIGICDDSEVDRDRLYGLCEQFFCMNKKERKYTFFNSGEEVIDCCKNENKLLDILFLDVEMSGISGLEVKDELAKYENIQRILFTSGYGDYVWDSFGKRTLGFIVKPVTKEKVFKWLAVIVEEICKEEYLEIADGNDNYILKLTDIAYLHADGNYTEIHLIETDKEKNVLVTKKLKWLLDDLKSTCFVRTHKSYAINLMNVIEVEQEITLRGADEKIPIGRAYKDDVKKKYTEYVRERILKRI